MAAPVIAAPYSARVAAARAADLTRKTALIRQRTYARVARTEIQNAILWSLVWTLSAALILSSIRAARLEGLL